MLDVSTRTLRALIALDEARHFSLAAERCNITQSALSQAIGKLEQQIGLRLVDRDRRRVNFTGEGERMVATARRVVLELDEISHDLREYAALRKGRVVIAAQPSLAAHWLPPTITQFKARYPGVSVGLFYAAPDRALELVRQRLADVALTAKGPGMVGLQHRLLFHDRFVVVCPRLKAWLREPQRGSDPVLFPSATGKRLTVHGVQYILNKRNYSGPQSAGHMLFRPMTHHPTREVERMALAGRARDRTHVRWWC